MFKLSIIICQTVLLLFSSFAFADDDFKSWIENYRQSIDGIISPKTLEAALNDLELSERTIQLSQKQPEQHALFWNYLGMMVTDVRIKEALEFKRKYIKILKKIEKKYGIDSDYLIALHAVETDLGKNTGNIPLTQTLATMAYISENRKKFFEAQLTALLKSYDRKVLPLNITGSWAGAFGYFQFMPSTYVIYGTDEDKDNKIDLFSYRDAFGSAANYLSKLGLKKNEPCFIEVNVPSVFKWENLKNQETHSVKKWKEMGLSFVNKEKNINEKWNANLLMPEGHQGPSFLIFNNFNILKKWNKSNYYVISACELVRGIKGMPRIKKSRFSNKSMSKSKIMRVQKKLFEMGLYEDKIDGIIGDKTRKAIQKAQFELGIPADGYPTEELLEIWKLNNEGNN